jgi:cyclic pyranopterin phosphate synthase
MASHGTKNSTPLTHLNASGEAHMVDVGAKEITARRAVAQARVTMNAQTLKLLSDGRAPKGDVLATARIAGISAAKRTSELIPLCHVIALTRLRPAIEPASRWKRWSRRAPPH